MKPKTMAALIRAMVLFVGFSAAVVVAWLLPEFGLGIADANPEFAYCYWPWLIFLWAVSLPCFVALGFVWRMARFVARGEAYCRENMTSLRIIGGLAAFSSGSYFLGNWVFGLLGMSHFGVIILALLITLLGMALALAAWILADLMRQGVALRQDSEGII